MTERNPIIIHLLIILSVWTAWYTFSPGNPFSYLSAYWEVSVTMVFGSLIAGGTSEGGGAVAFPVFTKILGISPHEAKVFSLAIQSVGMTVATLFIILTRIRVEWRAILFVSLGGIPGIALAVIFVAPHLPPEVVRITFTAMVSGFALPLLMMNRGIRCRNESIPTLRGYENIVLVATGLAGGMMSGLVGSGIDIFAFSVMVLLFRLCEKVATPTSVILMAVNALAGFALHALFVGDFTGEVVNYWLAAVPVVVVGAPLGALLCSMMEARTVAYILILLIGVELLTSLLLIPLTPVVITSGAVSLAFYLFLYFTIYRNRTYEEIQGAMPSGK